MSEAPVGNGETLHRSVPRDAVVWTQSGWHLTSEAFNDRWMRPSVDRRELRPNAADSKRAPDAGIVQLVAADIRGCDEVIQNPDAKPPDQLMYKLDVKPDPIKEDNEDGLPPNPAHAIIESAPMVASKSRFKKIKEALCRLAQHRDWVIQPQR